MTKTRKPEAPQAPEWIVQADGWVAGRRAKKGARVTLTAAQAKYENVRPA
jgi:hypothetical protein